MNITKFLGINKRYVKSTEKIIEKLFIHKDIADFQKAMKDAESEYITEVRKCNFTKEQFEEFYALNKGVIDQVIKDTLMALSKKEGRKNGQG